VIGGPFGRFSHDKGTSRQVWIAGSIGGHAVPQLA
jgi:predicted ferric reductase